MTRRNVITTRKAWAWQARNKRRGEPQKGPDIRRDAAFGMGLFVTC